MSIALIVCIVGGLVYYVLSAAGPEDGRPWTAIKEIGRLAFFAGLLAYLLKG